MLWQHENTVLVINLATLKLKWGSSLLYVSGHMAGKSGRRQVSLLSRRAINETVT